MLDRVDLGVAGILEWRIVDGSFFESREGKIVADFRLDPNGVRVVERFVTTKMLKVTAEFDGHRWKARVGRGSAGGITFGDAMAGALVEHCRIEREFKAKEGRP